MALESHIAVFPGTAHVCLVDRTDWSTSMVGEFRPRSAPRRGLEKHAPEGMPWTPNSNSSSSLEPGCALRFAFDPAEAPVSWTRHGDPSPRSRSRAKLGVKSTSHSRRPLTRAAGTRGMWGLKVRYCAYPAGNGGYDAQSWGSGCRFGVGLGRMRGRCGPRARKSRARHPRAPVSELRRHSSCRVEGPLGPPYPTEQGGQHGYRSKERWQRRRSAPAARD